MKIFYHKMLRMDGTEPVPSRRSSEWWIQTVQMKKDVTLIT